MTSNNQGEGDRESARRYNEEQQKFVKSGKVKKAVREAKDDPVAEEAGRSRAKELDPEERRDYTKPTEK